MKKKKSLIKPYLKRHGLKYIMGLILLLIVDYMSLVIPQITGDIIDGLTGFTIDKNGVLRLVFYLILATLAIVVGRVLYRSCIFGSCRKIEAEIRNDLFHKLEELSQKYYNHHKTGDLMANFTNDLDALRNAIGQAVISTFDAVVQTGMVLYKMIVYVNPTLTFITLIPMSIIAIAGFWVSDEMESKLVFDRTGVHPESYAAAQQLLTLCGYTEADVAAANLAELPKRLDAFGAEKAAEACGVGVPTLRDIAKELCKPGRDPRDELPPPILRTDVLELKDLKPGMVLTGTVRNVIDFGVFVDIGVHQDGLVHISRVCNRFIKHPSEVVSVGDIVKVGVLEVDEKRKRISLTMRDLPE